MTAGAGKLAALMPGVRFARQGMAAYRMAVSHPLHAEMAAGTEFIDRLVKLKLVVTGMGVMTRFTATAHDNAVAVKALSFQHAFLLVRVAGDTEAGPGIRPKLEPIPGAVGIVADRAGAEADRPMHMGLGFPFPFVDMTPVAEAGHPAGRHGNFLITLALTMAGQTLQVGRRTVPPLAPVDQPAMTGKADRGKIRIFLELFHIQAGIGWKFPVMATAARRGYHLFAVKEIDPGLVRGRPQHGHPGPVQDNDLFITGIDDKGIDSPSQG